MRGRGAKRRLLRAWFIRRIRVAAAAAGSHVELDIARDIDLGRRVVVDVAPGTESSLTIGAGTRIWDDVTIALRGGTVRIGPWCDLRRGVVVNASGTVELAGRNVVSWGTVIHCAGTVRIDELTSIGEYVTIVDSTHYHTDPDVPIHHNVKAGEVTIGRNAWIGAKATVLRGSRIGDLATVAASAVVNGDVPDGHLVSGAAATITPRQPPDGGITT